jgi:hypothetical protein
MAIQYSFILVTPKFLHMRKRLLLHFVFTLLILHHLSAQKKPLDHTVYDSWQSIGERMISNDGKWVVYSVNVQEGDNELVIQSTDNVADKKIFPRGYNAVITDDSRFAVFKIKPFFKDTREARIKKKRPDDMPKDSFAIVELGSYKTIKLPRIKTYKAPTDGDGWIAWHLDKAVDSAVRQRPAPAVNNDKKLIDSLKKKVDSLIQLVNQPAPETGKKKKKRDDETGIEEEADNIQLTIENDAEGDEPTGGAAADAGTDLVLRKTDNGNEKRDKAADQNSEDSKGFTKQTDGDDL